MTVQATSDATNDYVVGVDGCRDGWVAVELRGGLWRAEIFPNFVDLIDHHSSASVIGVDIPIGLTCGGVRDCDTAARRLLGRRHVCVFNPPDPRALDYTDRAIASDYLQTLGNGRIGVQTWMIVPKIAEVDAIMTPELQERIVEVHPEVSFCAMNGGMPLQSKKSRTLGFEERAELLRRELGIEVKTRHDLSQETPQAKPDDVLDAIVAAWTARRKAHGYSVSLPAEVIRNDRGLRMEIVF